MFAMKRILRAGKKHTGGICVYFEGATIWTPVGRLSHIFRKQRKFPSVYRAVAWYHGKSEIISVSHVPPLQGLPQNSRFQIRAEPVRIRTFLWKSTARHTITCTAYIPPKTQRLSEVGGWMRIRCCTSALGLGRCYDENTRAFSVKGAARVSFGIIF